ncbi:nucleotidyltransferase domain-containing protein [Patescibacteria group bacterium]
MDIKSKLFEELTLFCNKNLDSKKCFVCVCGSYASDNFTKDSDLDLLFAVKKYDVTEFKKIHDFVVNLHLSNDLKIDEEVPYETKLVITYEDIENAVDLEPFVKKSSGYIINPITYNKEFLASQELRLRIILNALTTPNIYIYGDKKKYVDFIQRADKAIIRLARGLTSERNPSEDEILRVLLNGKHGEEGQAHLGYKKDRNKVIEHLKSIIAHNINIQ